MNHYCHWPGCHETVPPRMWGCRRHWFTLPKSLRDKIWREYHDGQEITKLPSTGYIAAAHEVQEWIANEQEKLLHVQDCDCDPVRGTPGRECREFTRDMREYNFRPWLKDLRGKFTADEFLLMKLNIGPRHLQASRAYLIDGVSLREIGEQLHPPVCKQRARDMVFEFVKRNRVYIERKDISS